MTEANAATNPEFEAQSATALTLDAQEYLHFLADCDWSGDQKREFIQALWNIVVNFVDLGFGIHPLQQLPKVLGADSLSVLASHSISTTLKTEDAKADILPIAPGKDS